MKTIEFVGNQVKIDPPKRTKKITGTRFATILEKNPWSTPFEMWCAITKTYEIPFEDTIYTLAGKTIEPKQAEYMEDFYGMELIRPADMYGQDYFKTTYGDFFPKNKHFGGMWDYLRKDDETGDITAVLEMKTTKRVEDWQDDMPEYYALQASLYAYLLGVDDVYMVCSILNMGDYDAPEKYVPSVNNTIVKHFRVSERYPAFGTYISYAEEWWKNYVSTGLSPEFDEQKDAEILKALRTKTVESDAGIEELIAEAEQLKQEVDAVESAIADKQKRLKTVTDKIKNLMVSQFGEGDKKVTTAGQKFTFTVSKSESTTIDKDALIADGLLEKYSKPTVTYRMGIK